MGKKALLLVNMGGPSREEEIAPYLLRIFRDPAILPLPGLLRTLLGRMIVRRRLPHVRERYQLLGGGSPLPRLTQELIEQIREDQIISPFEDVTHAFRYSEPLLEDRLAELSADGYQQITLLPLFPHYTTAMTGSIATVAQQEAERLQLDLTIVPAWGADPGFLMLQENYLLKLVAAAARPARVLFVAHGIPVRELRRGDPYAEQVEVTARRLGDSLPEQVPWSLGYQSRLGPVKWTEPCLEEEIERYADPDTTLIIMPLSFVSDCLETLYDLDDQALKLGTEAGYVAVLRVPVFNSDPAFCRILLSIADGAHNVN